MKNHPDIPGLNQEIVEGNRSNRSRGGCTGSYKYFKYFEHEPVIEKPYDLKEDPLEQNNLASNPEYEQLRNQLRQKTEEFYKHETNEKTDYEN